ncbi:5490_t:CDS:2 [Dentiscutata erythropus]|uniref:5490_t:CDS:1 n=1 Tax=Dentiscutata erythropus TaxID=1348616 RepID=A0A9N9CWG1_9GLOM|nr:5490_t:CDS:2 [Dentiscutata erythropus]
MQEMNQKSTPWIRLGHHLGQNSKNILIQNDSAVVSGFGLAKSLSNSMSNTSFGFEHFGPPHCLKNYCECGKESNIYRFEEIIEDIFNSTENI